MLLVVAVLLIGAIVRNIEWKKIAVKWVAYNPKKAIIFIRTGDNVNHFPGEQDKNNSLMYEWSINRKDKQTIILPDNYPHLNLISQGRRIIGIVNGKPVASPLGFMTVEEAAKYKETIVEISGLTQSQMVEKALRSITRSKPVNWMMILIICGVAVAGFWYYKNNIIDKQIVNPPAISTNITQSENATLPYLILETPGKVIP